MEFKSFAEKILNKSEKSKKKKNQQLDIFAEFQAESTEDYKNESFESLKTTAHNYKLVDNQDEMRRLCDFFITKEILSLDTETTSTNAIEAELVGLSFSVKEHEAFYVPVSGKRPRK